MPEQAYTVKGYFSARLTEAQRELGRRDRFDDIITKDRVKTKEINILTAEIRELRARVARAEALIAQWRERQAIALPEYEGDGYGKCADELSRALTGAVADAD